MTVTWFTQDLINTVVKEFVDSRKVFTALNVSTEVQNRGGTQRHNDMKSAIHTSMANRLGVSYDRQLVQVGPNDHQTTYVYYPANANTSQTMVLGTLSIPTSTSRKSRTGRNATTSNSTLKSTGVDGRLLIPAKLVSKLGGITLAYAFKASDGTLLIRGKMPTSHGYDVVSIDNHHNIRLTKTLLKEAGLKGNTFRLGFNNGSIVVRNK